MKRKIRWFGVLCLSMLLIGCGKNPNKEGTEYLKEKKYDEAIGKFQEALKEKKHKEEAYLGMGMAYYETKRYKESKEALEKGISEGLEPSGTIYGILGDCALILEDEKVALSYYSLALKDEELGGDVRQDVLWNQIVAYEKQKDYKSAKEKLKAYLKSYPEDEKAKKELEFFKTRKL